MRVAIDNVTGCHIFQGCKTKGGYGRIRVGGVHWMAHRYAIHVHLRRPLTEGCVVMHSCDNPSCVNPEHLSEGTQVDNMKDCKEKGRMVRGGRGKAINRVQTGFEKRLMAVKEAEGTPASIAKKFDLPLQWVKAARSGRLDKHLK